MFPELGTLMATLLHCFAFLFPTHVTEFRRSQVPQSKFIRSFLILPSSTVLQKWCFTVTWSLVNGTTDEKIIPLL